VLNYSTILYVTDSTRTAILYALVLMSLTLILNAVVVMFSERKL
jgi:hypothetical protein